MTLLAFSKQSCVFSRMSAENVEKIFIDTPSGIGKDGLSAASASFCPTRCCIIILPYTYDENKIKL